MYLNLDINSFSLRILSVRDQLRRLRSIVRKDHYDRVSGNQWKNMSGLVGNTVPAFTRRDRLCSLFESRNLRT
jgi:hypothetical protein